MAEIIFNHQFSDQRIISNEGQTYIQAGDVTLTYEELVTMYGLKLNAKLETADRSLTELMNPFLIIGMASLAGKDTDEVIEQLERMKIQKPVLETNSCETKEIKRLKVGLSIEGRGIQINTEDFSLTLAELKVLSLRTHGHSIIETADQLNNNPHTAKKQRTTLLRKNRSDETNIVKLAEYVDSLDLLSPLTIVGIESIREEMMKNKEHCRTYSVPVEYPTKGPKMRPEGYSTAKKAL